MRDVCHSPLFFMSLIIRFISSPLPSGRLKAFFPGLWGFGPNKAKDTDTQKHTHTKGQLNSASLGGNAITRGLSYRTKHTHRRTHPNTLNLVPPVWQAIVLWDCAYNLFMND